MLHPGNTSKTVPEIDGAIAHGMEDGTGRERGEETARVTSDVTIRGKRIRTETVGGGIARETATVDETALAPRVAGAETDRERNVHARLYRTAPANHAIALGLHRLRRLRNAVAAPAHAHALTRARLLIANDPRSLFPTRRYPSAASTTRRNLHPNMEVHHQTRKSRTSRLPVLWLRPRIVWKERRSH